MSDTKQPEALRLADVLEAGVNFYGESSLRRDTKLADAAFDAADELRRLHAENESLRATPAREWQGLTDEEIASAVRPFRDEMVCSARTLNRMTRAIEAKLKERNA